MEDKERQNGDFTLPGEAGYEELTLEMAKKWGADVIRDSDGTKLSNRILNAGYDIYSTICIIRDHNEWARQNLDKLQQTFLITEPKVSQGIELKIELMKDFYKEQFQINARPEAMKYWQVYDRTTGELVSPNKWSYEQEEVVKILDCIPWHRYTVSFLAFRIWEEISMYNHTTNHWNSEHLMQIDPRYPETQEYLLDWMEEWCRNHEQTQVVRFTSLFYNFVWIWGSSPKKSSIVSDWASYDFTVSPLALDQFAKTYGYSLTAEDFVNGGKYQVTHMPPTRQKKEYMVFVHDFVIQFGKKLIEIVHKYGKKAYIFYDDSWVGVEPYSERFPEFGFDGIIKCVFSGFEARLCAGVLVGTHELRLHPYLFPVGLGGAPTFKEGGNPTKDARQYWMHIRRAILRQRVDRIGLGGYLHLVEPYQEFCDYIEELANEFRKIKQLHKEGEPQQLGIHVAVLHSWGKLRSWTLSGHFHETASHDLIHINEALSGLPVAVSFLNFEEVKQGALDDVQIVINAGMQGDAWSGGDQWNDAKLIETLTKWVAEGGIFLGVNEPSATEDGDSCFQMASVLGVDLDRGARVCHGRWQYEITKTQDLFPEPMHMKRKEELYLVDQSAKVLLEEDGIPAIVEHDFFKGKGIYLSGFDFSYVNARFLMNLFLYALDRKKVECMTDNPHTECAYFPTSHCLVLINNSESIQMTGVFVAGKHYDSRLEPYETRIIEKVGE